MANNITLYGQCRCCLATGNHRNITKEYYHNSVREVYMDIFLDCFNLSLSTSNEISSLICNSCIEQLREANKFKTMVVNIEQRLLSMTDKDTIFINVPNNMHSDIELDVKMEGTLNIKAESSSDLDNVDDPDFEMNDYDDRGTPETDKKVDSKKKKIKKVKSSDVAGKKMGRSALKTNFRENVFEVLYNSNASAIRSFVDYRYTCCFCSDCYERPEDLKNHNLECHDKSTLRNAIRKYHMNTSLKLDITGLRCTLCDTEMDMLDDLLNHLKDIHNRQIHTDIYYYMVPLKFEDDVLRCTFCRQEFVQFRLLMAHIKNVHYRNFVCEVCDQGFISKNTYQSHRRIHEIGNFKCDYCERVMDTRAKKLNHERVSHGRLKKFDGIAPKYVFKCHYCHQTFNRYYEKQKHLAEVHGVKMPGLQCKTCDRTFPNRSTYTIHIKRDHLMERTHGCNVCDMKFFTSCDLKDHMISHSGVKKYQCDICMKSFGRKKGLRQHLRIHVDDRKLYVCGQCGKGFLQKRSLAGHMRAKHSELV
ncbi:unnamed protein product [Colias eurytheme]|nr:unnamed protein product [Colias eurytheme]